MEQKIFNKELIQVVRNLKDEEGSVLLDMIKEIAAMGYCVVKRKYSDNPDTQRRGKFLPSESIFSPVKKSEDEYYTFTLTDEFFTYIRKEFSIVSFNDNGSYYIISCEQLGDEIIKCLKKSIVRKYRSY